MPNSIRRTFKMQPPWTTLVIVLPLMVTVLGNDKTGLGPLSSTSETLNPSITDATTPTDIVTQNPDDINRTTVISALGCQNALSPDGLCNIHIKNITMNVTYPCIFRCSYNPQMGPLRLEVHLAYKHPLRHPTFVSVEQKSYLNAWTLPILLPVHGEDQKFNSIEEILCPPENVNETVNIRITTRSESNITMMFSLTNHSYVLKKGDNVSVTVTPVSPWYKHYEWTGNENSVLVTADSIHKSDTVCAILALQNAECPVDTDESGLRAGRGHFQTFTSRAGMVAWRNDFPDGVHIIVLSLADDQLCTLSIPNTRNHTKRKKTVVLEVYDHATIWTTWYIYFLTFAVLAFITTAFTKLILVLINRKLGTSNSDDQRQLLEESTEVSGRYQIMEAGIIIGSRPNNLNMFGSSRSMNTGRRNVSNDTGSSGGDETEGGESETEGNERDLFAPTQGNERDVNAPTLSSSFNDDNYNRQASAAQPPSSDRPAIAPPTTYAPSPSLMNFTATFNPQFVWWWKRVAVVESDTAEAQVAEVGFQHGLVIMGVFAALPTTELIRSFLGMLMQHGVEDQCFFNSRCLTAFGTLPDFTRVFTNIGYIFTGIAFTVIVKKHKELTHNILCKFSAYNNVGVSRHYGLLISLGYSLIIQGFMSSLYHTCPNSVTIRLDMLFMYVVMVISVVTIWGLRHGDVTHHVYPTLAFISITLIMAEAREWIDKIIFWSIFSTFYSFILLANTILLAQYGTWSFSPYKMWCVRKGWKPMVTKLEEVLRQEDRTSHPIKVVRIMLGLAINAVLIIYGFVKDPNIYTYILVTFLTNMGLYFGNYILTKRFCYREKGTILAWVSLLISFLLWILALIAFFSHNTDSEASPSESRALNSPCDFLIVYDTHDVWHVFSAFALFTFFLGVLTLDDDLCHKPSREIHVF